MVSVPLAGDALEIVTGEVEPKENVGGSLELEGLAVREAVRVTLPVNPPLGVAVIVAALPVVAPGFIVMVPLFESAKVGGGT
jgi:hypothetical protein